MFLEQKIRDILKKLCSSEDSDVMYDLIKVEHGIVEVRAEIRENACGECVLPEQILAEILLNEIQHDLPIIRKVKVYKTTKGGDSL